MLAYSFTTLFPMMSMVQSTIALMVMGLGLILRVEKVESFQLFGIPVPAIFQPIVQGVLYITTTSVEVAMINLWDMLGRKFLLYM